MAVTAATLNRYHQPPQCALGVSSSSGLPSPSFSTRRPFSYARFIYVISNRTSANSCLALSDGQDQRDEAGVGRNHPASSTSCSRYARLEAFPTSCYTQTHISTSIHVPTATRAPPSPTHKQSVSPMGHDLRGGGSHSHIRDTLREDREIGEVSPRRVMPPPAIVSFLHKFDGTDAVNAIKQGYALEITYSPFSRKPPLCRRCILAKYLRWTGTNIPNANTIHLGHLLIAIERETPRWGSGLSGPMKGQGSAVILANCGFVEFDGRLPA